MATYTTAEHDSGANVAQSKLGSQVVYDRFDLTAALATNDVIRSVYIPKNAVLLDAWLASDDLDTHTTPTITLTLRVNDGSTQKNFFSASTVAQAGGLQRADVAAGNAVGYEVGSDDFYLEVLVAAGAATGASSGDIELCVCYTMTRINADV
jgi:hypothetical protein